MPPHSHTPFQSRITAALHNPTLQIALDRNTEQRVKGRNQRFAELPDAEAVRDRGRAIRIEALSHLDRYLEQFAKNVEKNGGRVHWAADAAEARQLMLDLIRTATSYTPTHPSRSTLPAGDEASGHTYAPLVAKSKSMVSEEIELNHALEAAGIRAVETDLGEFIVQLRHETPSHLITPAVHLRREDVSELFQKEFDMPPTLDVAAMTAVANRELRRIFFTADVGLSGVNFGVAETGTLALVTNEGNGRLSTTIPRAHIALMGIERLVPTLADLEVMMRLLPRSATAQKLTAYVSLITGPRRPDEPDGPEELHVILLDNGRSRTLGTELAESLLCIRCGACLNVCPVYREIGGHAYGSTYGGPIGSVVSPALFGSEFGELANASSLCGACRDICPVRIDIPTMLLAVRGRQVAEGRAPAWLRLGMKIWAWTMASPARYRLAQSVAALGTRLLARNGRLRSLPPPLDAWTRRRDFPVFAREP
ncbi:MAG: lactate utilization protein B, partial [Anaerolineales bacterium]